MDISILNILDNGQNNATGIVTNGQTLGQSMCRAIIVMILILVVVGGISHGVDDYVPEFSGNRTFHEEVYNHFQTMEVDDVKAGDTTVDGIDDGIVNDSMRFVMYQRPS